MWSNQFEFGGSQRLRTAFDLQPNGLNAARHLFASVVVYSHAFEVGGYGLDPLKKLTGLTTGDLGVAYFFSVSGFLIARSWIRKPKWNVYLWRRFLRIFSAFWVCLAISALILYPLCSLSAGMAFTRSNWLDGGRYMFVNFLL